MSARSVTGVALRTSPPAIPAGFVRRPRVQALVDRAAAGPVTLVSAGPGYGKTLCLADWVRHGTAPAHVAWLSVDRNDDSLSGLWAALVGAVRKSGAVPAGNELFDLRPATSFGSAEVGAVIDELADLPAPLCLVLDDVHELRDPATIDSIELLVKRLPPNLHLILSSRFDPPLRLRRLAVAGRLTEIRSRELAFTAAEVRELLAAAELPATDGLVDALVDRTRGWAAGLRMVATGLDRQAPARDLARLRGSSRPLAEYFLEEVLDRCPDDDRRFLLRCSVVDPVGAELARELTGDPDAQARLQRLAARHAFLVGLAGDHTWFSWHPLFRELLAHRLNLEEPGRAGRLHRRAGSWLAASGDHVGAISQLIRAGDWTAVGRLIVEHAAPALVAEQGAALADALEPAARQSRITPTSATLLASALRNFRHFDYEPMLRDANSAALAARDDNDLDSAAVEILVAVLRMAYGRARDPRSLVAAATEALTLIDRVPRSRLPAVERYRAITIANLGAGLLWEGDLPGAATRLSEARHSCREWNLELPELTAAGHLAILEAVHGRFERADRLAGHARAIAERHGWAPEPQASAHMVALAWAALSGGRLEAADRLIATAIGRGNPDLGCQAALALLSIEVALTRRDHPLTARRLADLSGVVVRGKGLPRMLEAWAHLAAAEARLLDGDPDEAARLVPDTPDSPFSDALGLVLLAKCRLAGDDPARGVDLLVPRLAQLDRFAALAVDGRLVAAQAAARLRRDAQSMSLITDAVEIAAAHGIVRPFLLLGEPSVRLLSRHQRLVGQRSDFVSKVLDAVGANSQTPGPAGVAPYESLTERERSVLAYLPTYMKSTDIADDLFLSVNTVKSHLQAIYRKLGVSSRPHAVRRAREAGLL